ncbi:hypothetical protein FQA39_LY10831 [Lamprigera yunnana]|nr:hypothetical protein FQA39_LY10831 [Lamprigera yunnana]
MDKVTEENLEDNFDELLDMYLETNKNKVTQNNNNSDIKTSIYNKTLNDVISKDEKERRRDINMSDNINKNATTRDQIKFVNVKNVI